MSSAIVVAPILMKSTLTGSTLLAGAAAGTAALVLAPIAVGMLLSQMSNAVGQLQESRRQACAAAFEIELQAVFDRVRQELEQAPISDRGRRKLLLHLIEIDAHRQRLSLAIGDGSLAPADGEDFRAEMERFSQEITRLEVQAAESREKRTFLLQRVFEACERFRRLGISRSATAFVDAQAVAERIRQVDGNDLEQDLDCLGRLAGKLESTLEEAVKANLEARGTIGKGAANPAAVDNLPSSESRHHAIERARIEDSRNEVRFFLNRLGTEAPESVTDTLANLAAEADVCLDLGRLEAIRDQFQLTWQNVHGERALSLFFARRLAALRSVLPADSPLGNEISAALDRGIITRDTHARFLLAVERFLIEEKAHTDREAVESRLRSQLAGHGIVILDSTGEADLAARLNAGRAVVLPTRHEGYHALLRLAAGGELTVRLLKAVAGEQEKQEITDYMRLRDREVKSDWCKRLDLLLEDFAGAGIFTFEQVRVEDDLEYVTLEQLEAADVDVSSVRPAAANVIAGTGSRATVPRG